MARATPPTPNGVAPMSSVNRIRKSISERTSARNTRQRSRFLTEASSSGMLQSMVDEVEQAGLGATASSSSLGKGKSMAKEQQGDEEFQDWIVLNKFGEEEEYPCSVSDKSMSPFRIMDLPTEIRLEIYRACLTRPYNILLSKREQPQQTDSDNGEVADLTDSEPLVNGNNVALGTRPVMARASSRRRITTNNRSNVLPVPEPQRNQTADPLLVNILRTSKEIYKEARGVFYSENVFTLDLNTAMSTLSCLHQRSRRQIKHVEVEIPTYNEILERFQETVRLSLRYCSGLKKLRIDMPFTLPGADGSGTTGNTTVYANGFDILRWLPQECAVELTGNICVEIERVVTKHLRLAKELSPLAYARRQLISSDTGPSTTLSYQLH